MSKVNILHLINQLGYGGGAERQLLLNLTHFDNAKVKSIVCQIYPEGTEYSDRQAAADLRNNGIKVDFLNLAGKAGWFSSLFRLVQLIRAEKTDVIHTSLLLADFLGLLAGAITRTPVVVTLVNATYGPEWVEDNPSLTKWKHRLFMVFYRVLIRHACSHAAANSEAVKANAVQHLGISAKKVTVVHRSLHPQKRIGNSFTLENLRSELALEGSYPVLLNIARVVPNKGQAYLLEAVAELKQEYPTIKLLIAGEITRQIDLTALCDQLDLQQNVCLLGYRNDVEALHQMSNIGVFSSIYEGFGNALAEACASGLPCVVTNIGGFVEIVDGGRVAVVVPSRSPRSLAEGIRYLCQNPQIAADLGKRAQQHVVETFAVDRAVSTLTEIYHRVLNRA